MSQSRISRAARLAAQLGVFSLVAAVASLLTSGTASASYASEIQQLQQEQSQLLGQLQSLQGQAASAGQQAAATQAQITSIQQRLAQEQAQLSQVNAELTSTNNRLALTKARMALDRSQLSDLVDLLYERGSGDSFADTLANSGGVSQFLDQTLDLQTLRQRFSTLTDQLVADTDSLKTLQATQQVQQQQVAGLVSGLQSQNSQLQAAESTYRSEQDSLGGEAAQVAAQVQGISNQILLLEEAEAASWGGGSGEAGTILHVYSGYPNLGPYPDDYPRGQCTWFAASEALITWAANANGWISGDLNSADPYPIGSTPRVGSIVVFAAGGAYNYEFGHVAWVVAVEGAAFIVDEANFVNGYDEDQRYVPNTDGVEGFIYP